MTDIELVVRRAGNFLYVIAVKRGGSPRSSTSSASRAA